MSHFICGSIVSTLVVSTYEARFTVMVNSQFWDLCMCDIWTFMLKRRQLSMLSSPIPAFRSRTWFMHSQKVGPLCIVLSFSNTSHSRHHSKYIHPMGLCLLKLKPTICKLPPNNTNLFFCFVTNANRVLAGSNTQKLWSAALILTFPRAAMLITPTLPPIER